MQSAAPQPQQASRGKLRLTYLIFIGALLSLIVSVCYGAYTTHQRLESQLPRPNLETVVRDLRQFHQQTGRFPHDFSELDERLWGREKRERISNNGKSLFSPSGNYHYTLHTVASRRACIWAVPVGARAEEAATHFWTVTPQRIERWMGPALRIEQVSVVRDVPSESQLALLAMTKQTSSSGARASSNDGAFSIFSLLGF
ncbi:MAG: hypothetical protein M3458_03425 [Acidobacteriota bacterium]|nr:hypothetical protein [Acidobacteriota bacterium]